MAGSSTTLSGQLNTTRLQRFDVTYVADDADGSIPAKTVTVRDGLLSHWEHNPGATVATSGFDVTLVNDNGVDALCGGGVDIITTAGANATGGPLPDGSLISPVPVSGTLDVTITGNSVNDATGVFSFYVITL